MSDTERLVKVLEHKLNEISTQLSQSYTKIIKLNNTPAIDEDIFFRMFVYCDIESLHALIADLEAQQTALEHKLVEAKEELNKSEADERRRRQEHQNTHDVDELIRKIDSHTKKIDTFAKASSKLNEELDNIGRVRVFKKKKYKQNIQTNESELDKEKKSLTNAKARYDLIPKFIPDENITEARLRQQNLEETLRKVRKEISSAKSEIKDHVQSLTKTPDTRRELEQERSRPYTGMEL